MGERKVIKAVNSKKQEIEKAKEVAEVNLEAQERLVEILTDSPRIVSLNGSEWAIKALRMGTQYLIAKKVIEIKRAEDNTFGDIIQQFAVNIPAVIEIITLALLNDKNKIFKNGVDGGEYSELYETTYQTLMWECKVEDFGNLLLEILQLIDTNFFMESCRILEMFKMSTTARTKMTEQK
ncbi:MAG: hypothetical protein II304_00435 [Bacteroidales bacterium]|nr:hypothetical protein [Bacteroidales bacterium]